MANAYDDDYSALGSPDDDPATVLGKIMSPASAASLVQPMTGVSNPPNGGAVTTIDTPTQATTLSPARTLQPAQAMLNVDPQGSLRPEGTTPQASPAAKAAFRNSLPQPAMANVTGPRPAHG